MCEQDGCGREDIKARGLCQTHYNQWHYKENKKEIKARTARRRNRAKAEAWQLVQDFKSDGCVRCGYNRNNAALDCHHVEDVKHGRVAKLVYVNPDRVAEELERCIVLCANCHREEHSPIA